MRALGFKVDDESYNRIASMDSVSTVLWKAIDKYLKPVENIEVNYIETVVNHVSSNKG